MFNAYIYLQFYAELYDSLLHRAFICCPTKGDVTLKYRMSKDNNEQLNISKTQICKLETLLMTTKIQVIKCHLSQLDNFGTFNS